MNSTAKNLFSRQAKCLVPPALLLGVTALCYWPSLKYLFVYDDYGYVVANFKLAHGLTLETLKWAFTTFDQANWHPLTWIVFLAEYPFFRFDPVGYHATNIILHAANVILVFYLFETLTKKTTRSFIASLLFCVHPAHIESVVWISELKDVLSCFFWLTAMLFYIAYSRKKTLFFYCGTGVLMTLGLMTKPMLVTLPFAFLLLDVWPLKRFCNYRAYEPETSPGDPRNSGPSGNSLAGLLVEKIPFFLLSAAGCVITVIAQKAGGAVASLELLPLWQRAGNALISYVMYLYHFVWPVSLAFHYPHPGAWPIWGYAACAGLLFAISAGVILLRRQAPYLLIGWLWYLGTLVPVIGIVQVGFQAMADRYLYIPSIGLCIAIVWGFADIIDKLRHGKLVMLSLGCSAIFLLMLGNISYLKYWSDEISLYEHGLSITGPNYVALHNLGYVYYNLNEFDKAQYYLEQALRLSPSSFKAHINLGLVYAKQKRYEKATEQFLIASKLRPNDANAFINLANIAIDRGEPDKAISLLGNAIRLDSDSPIAHANIAFVYFNQDELQKAKEHFKKAIELYPNYITPIYRLGLLEMKLKNYANALDCFNKTIEIDPSSYDAWNSKGTAYVGMNDMVRARESFERAIELKSDFKIARDNLKALGDLKETNHQ